ncbi:AAA family ATPase [Humibacter sp.]|uniref:AAA family ATPase n=1 Tax=Humibacter sp. TaxID=1940291 RepID=UPI003F7FD939
MTTPKRRSLSLYEGWKTYAERPTRTRPDQLRRSELNNLDQRARQDYDIRRRDWHANLLLRTRQVEDIHLQLGDIVDSNMQDADRVKSTAVIDAPPTLGKSTTINAFGRAFHQEQLLRFGDFIEGDDEVLHLPVCHVTLTGRTTIKGLHEMILGFFAHPATHGVAHYTMRGRDLARAAAECLERHSTRLVIVDDLHFLNMHTRDGVEVANQLKWLANEYEATFLFAGVALRASGLIGEGKTGAAAAMAQTFRRWTVLGMNSFTLRTANERDEWSRMIRGLGENVVLADQDPEALVNLSDYLFARSTGNIGSLMDLIRRGTSRAIRTGAEALDRDLLDGIRIDEGAERSRAELEAQLARPRTGGSRSGRARSEKVSQKPAAA